MFEHIEWCSSIMKVLKLFSSLDYSSESCTKYSKQEKLTMWSLWVAIAWCISNWLFSEINMQIMRFIFLPVLGYGFEQWGWIWGFPGWDICWIAFQVPTFNKVESEFEAAFEQEFQLRLPNDRIDVTWYLSTKSDPVFLINSYGANMDTVLFYTGAMVLSKWVFCASAGHSFSWMADLQCDLPAKKDVEQV